jgi:LacI family transcriptional regulator, galactose operon repressor
MAPRDIDSARIAKIVGVSRSTVSKVINDYPNISEATRAKVLAAVRQHQYFPDYSAQVLAGKKTKTIGLFFANDGHWSEDLHVAHMISSMIEHAAVLGYHILTNIIRNPSAAQTANTIKGAFYQGRIDGGVFLGFKNHESVIEELIADGFVIGIFDQNLPGREEPNRIVVSFDDQNTAEAAIEYLVGLGHRKIAVLNGDRSRNAGQAKYEGYVAGLERNGIPIIDDWTLFGDFREQSAYEIILRFVRQGRELPTAIAAVNDNCAFGAMKALSESGIRVPEDISIIGMDGHPLSAYVRPALTTFVFDFDFMLKTLVQSVANAADRPGSVEPVRAVFPGQLLERDSCRAV